MKITATTIAKYNAMQKGDLKKVCALLKKEFDTTLKKAESKIWHGSPVWFLDGNPVAGYSIQKRGVVVLFWSGQSFTHKGLEKEGSFKAAQIAYTSPADVKLTDLRKWLRECKTIQWDYKNIVKNRGKLHKIITKK
ncbi:MAG: DUF1801 domain-containing protein [Candidatus Kerfeldbacteria bacterium]|nr:DUF1801 domain-containing protein [Candidatus Kerfeldbacteria bacterium]